MKKNGSKEIRPMKFENGVYTHSTLEEGDDYFVSDKWEKKYHFKIATFPVPTGVYSEAIEVIGDEKGREPYIFALLSDFDADVEQCEILLKAKIIKGINKRFLTERHGRLEIGYGQELRGRIDWTDDLSDTNIEYILSIDGKRITFEKLAEMLQGVEGFNFRFSIHDISDEDPD